MNLPFFPLFNGFHTCFIVILNVLLCSSNLLLCNAWRCFINRRFLPILPLISLLLFWGRSFQPRLKFLKPASSSLHVNHSTRYPQKQPKWRGSPGNNTTTTLCKLIITLPSNQRKSDASPTTTLPSAQDHFTPTTTKKDGYEQENKPKNHQNEQKFTNFSASLTHKP